MSVLAVAVSAQERDLIGKEVSIPQHLRDGDEFELSIPKLIEFGEKLFSAKWTSQEAAGRPNTKGTATNAALSDPGQPLVFPRNFNRISAPDRMAEKYLDGSEYNSYKHGLRIHSAESALAVAATPRDLKNAFIMNSPHSVTHLDFKKEPGATVVMVQTKQFNPEESRGHIGIMADILANVKRIRLAMLSGAQTVEMTKFSQMDKGGLQRLATCQSWSFSA